ncbi:hypothetical protein WG947_16740 [Pontibacter sp. H259]|uniref:hypothetical protein n=1 Tax=Pontibacter sp. H259 TaxID=3133421 RepID=UPI0030C0414E
MKKLYYLSFLYLFSCNQSPDSHQIEVVKLSDNAAINVVAKTMNTIQTQADEFNERAWTFDKVDGTKLVFKEGSSFDTELFNLEYIGQIDIDPKAPYLIYSGRDCNECDANTAIYFHSPRHGQLHINNGENRYGYPGRVSDYETDSLVYQSRAFYGEVLKGVNGIVWYQKTLMEDNSFESSVYIARLHGESIKGEEIKEYNRHLQETISLNKLGKNIEIQGRDYTSEL